MRTWYRRSSSTSRLMSAALLVGLAGLLAQANSGCIEETDTRSLVLAILEEEEVQEEFRGEQGEKGDPGEDGASGKSIAGAPGEDGLDCWDLNANGLPDVATEDTNGDGVVDVEDCRAGFDCADCDDQFVNEGQADSISLPMIQNGAVTGSKLGADSVDSSKIVDNSLTADDLAANSVGTSEIAAGAVDTNEIANVAVTQDKIAASGAQDGYVLKTHGSAMSWERDEVTGSPWQNDANGIHYEYNVGIRTSSSVDYELCVDGGLRVTGDASISGDVVLGCDTCNPVRIEDNIDIGGNVLVDWLSAGSGTTVVWGSDDGRLYRLSSSLRYKHDVSDLPATKEMVLGLRPVTFTWNSTGEADIGLIAEEVAEVLPDLVLYDTEGRPDGVKYDRLGLYLLQVIKSQREQIGAQERRLERMECELAELKAEIQRHR